MEQNIEEIPVLVGQGGQYDDQRWILTHSIVLGRGGNCDIHIPNMQVSRQHARLSRTSKGILLEDLNSKNGTFYNGQRIKGSVYLNDGDIIQIALAQSFALLSADATLPIEVGEFDLPPIQKNRLRLENLSRRVWIGDSEVLPPLSASQFRLLETLYDHQGRVVPRYELIKVVWGEEKMMGVSDQALDALVRRLRDRLTTIDSSQHYIVTVRGHGLRLDNPKI